MKDIRIRDLYAGRPDAKDEIYFDGSDSFIKTFVVADHFNLDLLISGKHCFITGFKGTGKTALLFYLDDMLKSKDSDTCSSFIFFKENFSDTERTSLQAFSRRISSSITVASGALTTATDFEYIWRWIILKQIVSDNEECSRNLFLDDEKWQHFERIVSRIKDPLNKRKILIPNKIKLSAPFKDPSTLTEVTPEIEVDLREPDSQSYQEFIALVDEAEAALACLNRSDIPYYIFIDELEAYYGDENVFLRDLSMIRDLLFTVKRLNTVFARSGMKQIKIFCSVRSEILTAISRFVVTKELNKAISGFSVPLNWSYTNNNSYAHPIIQILLKRIAVCSECESEPSLAIYRKWFPETIHSIEPASYILNNSWCKPRDMVRLIATAQNSLHNNASAFSEVVFNSISRAYSEDSLQEIKEELRALYTSEEIDSIITCFTGFRTTFSLQDLRYRVKAFFANTVLDNKFIDVLQDLYRLGFLGNFLPATKSYHWQHKGDPALIISDEWRIFIHYALHGALSLRSQNDVIQNRGKPPQAGDTAKGTVIKILEYFAIIHFTFNGISCNGSLHISEFKKLGYGFIANLSDVVHVGEQYDIVLIQFDSARARWKLQLNTGPDNKAEE